MQTKQYDGPPSTFVNVKRVKQETDDKGRERTQITLGTYTDSRTGVERNSLNELIEALLVLQDKQVNLDIRVEMKESSDGRKFPSAFLRVTEMIPKNAGGGKTAFVPKTQGRASDVKARAAKIQQDFKG
jgi:hypothetical protein